MVVFINNGLGQYGPSGRPRVGIMHKISEGYTTDGEGNEIREELDLGEFLNRLHDASRKSGRVRPMDRKEVNDLYSRITDGIRAGNAGYIEHLSDHLNRIYASLIREGVLVLAQHSARRVGTTAEKTAMDYHREYMMNEQSMMVHNSPRGMEKDQSPKINKTKKEKIYYLLA